QCPAGGQMAIVDPQRGRHLAVPPSKMDDHSARDCCGIRLSWQNTGQMSIAASKLRITRRESQAK
ncbi:MAG: hypothetical protein JSU70_19405, partial [Phycisphaerales bacterium]